MDIPDPFEQDEAFLYIIDHPSTFGILRDFLGEDMLTRGMTAQDRILASSVCIRCRAQAAAGQGGHGSPIQLLRMAYGADQSDDYAPQVAHHQLLCLQRTQGPVQQARARMDTESGEAEEAAVAGAGVSIWVWEDTGAMRFQFGRIIDG